MRPPWWGGVLETGRGGGDGALGASENRAGSGSGRYGRPSAQTGPRPMRALVSERRLVAGQGAVDEGWGRLRSPENVMCKRGSMWAQAARLGRTESSEDEGWNRLVVLSSPGREMPRGLDISRSGLTGRTSSSSFVKLRWLRPPRTDNPSWLGATSGSMIESNLPSGTSWETLIHSSSMGSVLRCSCAPGARSRDAGRS